MVPAYAGDSDWHMVSGSGPGYAGLGLWQCSGHRRLAVGGVQGLHWGAKGLAVCPVL